MKKKTCLLPYRSFYYCISGYILSDQSLFYETGFIDKQNCLVFSLQIICIELFRSMKAMQVGNRAISPCFIIQVCAIFGSGVFSLSGGQSGAMALPVMFGGFMEPHCPIDQK